MINIQNPASASIKAKSKIEVEMEKAINRNEKFSSNNSSPKGMEGFENFSDLNSFDDNNVDIKIMNQMSKNYFFCLNVSKTKFLS